MTRTRGTARDLTRRTALIAAAVALCGVLAPGAGAAEVEPLSVDRGGQAVYATRTVSAAIAIDRDAVRVVALTVKDRPFRRALEIPAPRAQAAPGGAIQVEFALLGPGAARLTLRIDVAGLCLDHPGDDPPHVTGDRVRLHRETLLVELPELPAFDVVEIARYAPGAAGPARVVLGSVALPADRASAPAGAQTPFTLETVHWPEEYGDSTLYTIYGDAAEVERRINIVIVPDGYTYSEKSTMISHAEALVSFFRNKTPYREHDPFINYILVYAYSTETGTDECDCGTVRDTAMNTRFPLITSTCGSSDNRCLYYGAGNGGPNCDPNVSSANIAAAELRAPARDATLVMVNTGRYGGCGGYRAVYSAGNASAVEIAAHELGHSLANLADEYAYTAGCGSYAGEINTSTDPNVGAWPEWIAALGAPQQGAEYYQQCIYRPQTNCEMRALAQPFCAVCRQQWALTVFGHPRVAPTAPIESASPASPVTTLVGAPLAFSLKTRLGILGVTNDYTWRLAENGDLLDVLANAGPDYDVSLPSPGAYVLTATLTADTNFVKPERYDANVDTVTWMIEAQPIPEVSGDANGALTARASAGGVTLRFADVGAAHYNLYVSRRPVTSPFQVASPQDGAAHCALSNPTAVGGGLREVTGVDLGSGISGSTGILFFLVTADNGPGTEGSLGRNSAGVERTADAYCAR